MPRTTKNIEPRKQGCKKKAERLTLQQRIFVEELVADPLMSPAQAAINAGYAPGYAKQQANALLKNSVIQQMVGKAVTDRLNRTHLSQDDVLKFLYNALMLDPLDLFNTEDGMLSLKDLTEIPVEIRRLITKIEAKQRTLGVDEETGEPKTEVRIKVEWVSKELALQLCMKHLGLTGPDNNVNVNVSVDQTLVMQLREAVASKSRVVDGNVISEMAKND